MNVRKIIPKQVKDAIRNVYAWPGGYPLYILMHDGEVLCVACGRKEFRQIARSTITHALDGWTADDAGINWEDNELQCSHCNTVIPSAYGKE